MQGQPLANGTEKQTNWNGSVRTQKRTCMEIACEVCLEEAII